MTTATYDGVFDEAGRKYNVDPSLIKTAWLLESGGRSAAPNSYAGAEGPMQMLPATAAAMGVTDTRDMTQAVHGAARYLSEGLDATGSPGGALAYYHGGPDRSIWGPKTVAYVARGAATYPTVGVQRVVQKQDDPDASVGRAAFEVLTKGNGAARAGDKTQIDPDQDAGQAAFQAMTADARPEQPARVVTPIGVGADTPPTPEAAVHAEDVTNAILPKPEIGMPKIPTTIDQARALLAEKPGYTASGIFPVRVKNDPNGQADMSLGIEPDLGPLRSAGNAILDLLQGTKTGTITPEATQLLAGVMMGGGLTPSIARGTGAAIADTAMHGAPVADLYAKNRLAAPAQPAASAVPANRLAPEGARPAPTPGAPPAPPDAAPANRLNPTSPDATRAAGAPPAPNSVGAAAASAADAAVPAKDALAYRATAEGQKLLEPQPVGTPDNNIYVPGVTPNLAEIEQSVNTARELKALHTTAPEISQEAKNIAADNSDARQQHFAMLAGSDVDVVNAKAARSARAEKDLAATWASKTPADPAPILDLAKAIKDSPDGRRPVVRSAVDAVVNELTGRDGKLLTDPEQLYGVRKHIDDLMSKEAGATDPKSVRAMANLGEMKTALDAVIEKSAPGFADYLKNFAEASRPIDAMEVLQKHETRLFDAGSRMTYAKVQNMMRQIVESRQAPGINPYKSIPDDIMQQLWNLRDDLRRSASAQELARTPGGSDTAQNAWDIARQIGVQGAAHVGANLLTPGIGSLIVQGAQAAAKPIMASRRAQKATQRGMEILHPPKTILRNRLTDEP